LIEVRSGAEIALISAVDMAPERLGELGLGGGSWLLIESPFTPAAGGIDLILLDIVGRGHRVVLAHPERCAAFHRDRAVLESVVCAGILTSITVGSLVGRFGGEVRRFALGLVHNVAPTPMTTRSGRPGWPPSCVGPVCSRSLGGSCLRCPPRSSPAARSRRRGSVRSRGSRRGGRGGGAVE
jgi:protein-tyrosine phosphatase